MTISYTDSIFGQLIHVFDIESFNEVEKELIQYCYQFKKNDPDGRKISNRGGWQSEKDIPKDSILYRFIKDSVVDYFKNNKIFKENIGLQILDPWININQKGDYNLIHDHPRCDMSGVLWIKTHENAGDLVFENHSSFAQYNIMKCYSEGICKNFHTYPQWKMKSHPGRMVIFPSDLRHGVEVNESRQDRVSVSWNIGIHTLSVKDFITRVKD